jgi:hypothetical protein
VQYKVRFGYVFRNIQLPDEFHLPGTIIDSAKTKIDGQEYKLEPLEGKKNEPSNATGNSGSAKPNAGPKLEGAKSGAGAK